MKIKELFFLSVFCVVASLGFVSCQDDDIIEKTDDEPMEPLVLEMQVGAVLSDKAAVQLFPSSDEGEYYLQVFTDAEFQTVKNELDKTMAELAATHPEKVLKGGQTFILDGLEASSGYVVCAAPVSAEDAEASVKQRAFTTRDKAFEKLNVIESSLVDWADDSKKGKNEYVLQLSENTFANTWKDDGRRLRLEGRRPLVKDFMPEDPAFFNGVYTLSDTEELWAAYAVNTWMDVYKDKKLAEKKNMKDCEYALVAADGKFRAIGFFVTEDDQTYEVDYTVGLDVFAYKLSGNYGYRGYKPQLEEDRTDLEYTLMKEATYCGVKNGVALYSLACVHDPDPNINHGGFMKHCLRLNLHAPVGKYPLMELPSGTYTIDTEAEAYTPFVAVPGDRLKDFGQSYNVGCFYYIVDNTTIPTTQTNGYMRKGTIEVSREGEVYTIKVDASTQLGCKITGTFKGKFNITVEDIV